MDATQIPQQLFYKIGDVSRFTGVKPHVLRYWEAEFGLVKPRKDRLGQRVYRRQDIEIIFRIKELLHEQHFSILGAKQKLKEDLSQQQATSPESSPQMQNIIEQQKKQLQELLKMLESQKG